MASVEEIKDTFVKLDKSDLIRIIIDKNVPDNIKVSDRMVEFVPAGENLGHHDELDEKIFNNAPLQAEAVSLLTLQYDLKIAKVELDTTKRLITALERTIDNQDLIITLLRESIYSDIDRGTYTGDVDLEDNVLRRKTWPKGLERPKAQKTEKPPIEDQDFKFLIQNKKIMKTIVAIITSLFFVIAIITVVIIELNANPDDDFYEIPPTAHTENLRNHQILTKKNWNGRPPRSVKNITLPVKLVIIKHTGGGTCNDFQSCAGKAQTLQGWGMSEGLPDIYCNFLIGGDGNIYVGRGWDVPNDHRDSTIDIVYMGNFDIDNFTDTMIEAGLLLIKDGVKKNKLPKNYKVVCHNQTIAQRSPGKNVFREVVNWPGYDPGLYFSEK